MRAMVEMFEREHTPDSPSGPVPKLRSVSTPVPGATRGLIGRSGVKGIERAGNEVGSSRESECAQAKGPARKVEGDAKVGAVDLDRPHEGKDMAADFGCLTTTVKEGGEVEERSNECPSVYPQPSKVVGTGDDAADDKNPRDPPGTANPSTPQVFQPEKHSNDSPGGHDEVTDSPCDIQRSTPKARPIQPLRILPTIPATSRLDRPHAPSVPASITALLSDHQPDHLAVPLPLAPADPAAAAF